MTDTTPTPPVYEDIVMTRTLGRGVRVKTAPEHALMSLAVLRDPGAYIRETTPGHLLLADQVEYLVTGYDPERVALTLRLVEDHRPTARLTFGGVVDTRFRQVGEGPVCDGNLLPRRTEWRGEHGPELVSLPRREPGAARAAIEAEYPDETDGGRTEEAEARRYGEQVNAPLPERTVAALRDRIAAGKLPTLTVPMPARTTPDNPPTSTDTPDNDPYTGLVVGEYRHDRGHQAWVFRCWGDDTYDCDGWLSLDHTNEAAAIRSRDRHVAEKHITPTPTED